MNLVKYKRSREKAFKLVNQKITLQEVGIYTLQTALGAIFTHQVLSLNLSGAIASAVAMLGLGYFNNKALDKLTDDRLYESGVALGLFKFKNSKGKKEDFKKFNNDINLGITTYEIIKDYKNIKKDILVTQTCSGIQAMVGANYLLNDNLIVGVVFCGMALGFVCLAQGFGISCNNSIKDDAKYFSSRYAYNIDDDEYKYMRRD